MVRGPRKFFHERPRMRSRATAKGEGLCGCVILNPPDSMIPVNEIIAFPPSSGVRHLRSSLSLASFSPGVFKNHGKCMMPIP